jgi:hypothetical protein
MLTLFTERFTHVISESCSNFPILERDILLRLSKLPLLVGSVAAFCYYAFRR